MALIETLAGAGLLLGGAFSLLIGVLGQHAEWLLASAVALGAVFIGLQVRRGR